MSGHPGWLPLTKPPPGSPFFLFQGLRHFPNVYPPTVVFLRQAISLGSAPQRPLTQTCRHPYRWFYAHLQTGNRTATVTILQSPPGRWCAVPCTPPIEHYAAGFPPYRGTTERSSENLMQKLQEAGQVIQLSPLPPAHAPPRSYNDLF